MDSVPLVMYLLVGTMIESVLFIIVVGLLFRMLKQQQHSSNDHVSDDVTNNDVTVTDETGDTDRAGHPPNAVHPEKITKGNANGLKMSRNDACLKRFGVKIVKSKLVSFFRRHPDSVCFVLSTIFNTIFVLACLIPMKYY
jgi:hypothetical protein